MQPLTRAERTNYRETSLHSDVIEFIRALSSPQLKVEFVGTSLEGREIPLLIFHSQRVFTPEEAARRNVPSVLIINNIHAGEVEGKEASLMLAREIVLGGRPEWIRGMVLLILPLFNVDGNDRISPRNRALNLGTRDGQIGPEGGVGTRTTSEGINLNRDYIKVEAREMRLFNEKIFHAWKPVLTVDCHTTDGSLHAYELTYGTAMNPAGEAAPAEYVSRKMLPEVSKRLFARTGIRTAFYGNWVDETDPSKGWRTYSHLPRYGSHYRGLCGRMDILSETYSYMPFEARVRANREFLVEVMNYCARNILEMQSIVDSARARTATGPPGMVPIASELDPSGDEIEILQRPFCVTIHDEGDRIRYTNFQQGEVKAVRTKYLGRFRPTRWVERPYGYLVPGDNERLRETLRLHDIRFETAPVGKTFEGNSLLVSNVSYDFEPDCGVGPRRVTRVTGSWGPTWHKVGPDTLLIPAAQPQGNLVVYLFEPESDDGLTTWGFFDALLQIGKPHPVIRLSRKPMYL